MRRTMQIRVAFEPTRLSAEHLRTAYELVLPIVTRSVTTTTDDVELEERENKEQLSVKQRRRIR